MKVKHIFSRCPKEFEKKLQAFLNTLHEECQIQFSTRSSYAVDGFSALIIYS